MYRSRPSRSADARGAGKASSDGTGNPMIGGEPYDCFFWLAGPSTLGPVGYGGGRFGGALATAESHHRPPNQILVVA